jgi:hypothetical protein
MAETAENLVAVLCVLCRMPVAHYDPTVQDVRVGGLCSRASCRTDPRNGMRRQVYTFHVVRLEPQAEGVRAAPVAKRPPVG